MTTGESILGSEFQFDKDCVFAAMKKGVGIQSVLNKTK